MEPGSTSAWTNERPTLLSATALQFTTRLSGAVLSLLNVLIVSRALGPSGRGTVAFLLAVAILSSQIASMSISESASNIAGSSPNQRAAVATNACVFALFLGIITAGVLAGLLAAFPGFGPRASTWLVAVTLATVPPLILLDYLPRLALADYGFGVVNVSIVLPAASNVVANGILYATGNLSVASAVIVWIAGQLAALALLAWYVQNRLAGFGLPDVRLGRRMLSFGLKAHGSRILMWGNYRLDQWLVGAIAGTRELGLYSVAVAWAEGLFMLPTTIGQLQRPDLVRSDRASAGVQATRAFRMVALATVVLAVGLVVLAPFLCVTVFGPSFSGSVDDLRVLAVGAVGIVAVKIFGNALVAQGKPLLEAIASLLAFCFTVALDLILIPGHGGLGAALASTIAYIAGGIAIALIASRTLGFAFSSIRPGRADFDDVGALVRRTVAHVRIRRSAPPPLLPSDPH